MVEKKERSSLLGGFFKRSVSQLDTVTKNDNEVSDDNISICEDCEGKSEKIGETLRRNSLQLAHEKAKSKEQNFSQMLGEQRQLSKNAVLEQIVCAVPKIKWNAQTNEQFEGGSGIGAKNRGLKIVEGDPGEVVQTAPDEKEILVIWKKDPNMVPRPTRRDQVTTVKDAEYSELDLARWGAHKVFGGYYKQPSQKVPKDKELNPKFEMWIGGIKDGIDLETLKYFNFGAILNMALLDCLEEKEHRNPSDELDCEFSKEQLIGRWQRGADKVHRINRNLRFIPLEGDGKYAQLRRFGNTWMISGYKLNVEKSSIDQLIWDDTETDQSRQWIRLTDEENESSAAKQNRVAQEEKETEEDKFWKTVEFDQDWYRHGLHNQNFLYQALACQDFTHSDVKWAFDDCYNFLRACENKGLKVLVHCGQGRNRSAAAIVSYLNRRGIFNTQDCIEMLSTKREKVLQRTPFIRQLLEDERDLLKAKRDAKNQ